MTAEKRVRLNATMDDLYLIEDALSYYRMSMEQGGPDDHPWPEVRRVEHWIGRYISREEGKADASLEEGSQRATEV